MNVFYPRLLDGNLNVLRRIEPVRGSLDMELEPLSSAELELQPGDSIPERSWVAVFTAYGLAGIFRSKPQRDRYGERSATVSLVHGATELNDYLTGKTDEDVQSAANTAIQTIFSAYHGSLWTLGTVSPTASVVYGLNNSGVLDALVDLMEQLPGYMVTFDQTVTPWEVNIVPRPSEVTAEGRLSRNIQSVEISRDDSSLCTKVYYGENNSYVQDTTAVQKYGVIEHRISDSGYTDVQLAAMAQAYLDSHKAPKLSVSISAIDLSQITGEPLDQISLGSKYRLVIPDAETEENRVIEQIVCSVRYDDFLSNPNPQITLASDPESIITFLKQQRRSGGAGRAVKQLEEKVNNQYQYWTTENEVYKESVYKIMGVTYDENGVIYQTDPETGEIIYDAARNPIPVYDETSNGSITGKVVQTAQNYNSLYQMTLNAPEFDPTATYDIGSMVMYNGTVYRFTAAHTGDWTGTDVAVVPPLQSQITQNATEISQKVSQGALSGYLTITAAKTKLGNVIEWSDGSIKAAEVVTAINEQTGQTQVQISADQIDLQGYVTADEIFATDAQIGQYLKADNIIVTRKIRTAEFQATNGAQIESGLEVSDGAVIGGGLIADSISVGTSSSNTPLGNVVTGFGTVTPDPTTGEITIPYSTFQYPTAGDNNQNINFNIADMAYYQNHVGINTAVLQYYTDDPDEAGDWTVSIPTITLNKQYGLIKVTSNKAADDFFYIPINASNASGTASIDDITAQSITPDQTRTTVTIKATGTNVSDRTEDAVLTNTTYTDGGITYPCVNLTLDNTVIGRISTQSTYTSGETAGKNATNVVKGTWSQGSITYTTNAPSPNASAPKTLTLTTDQNSWTWTAGDGDSGNYQKQVYVKDSAVTNPILTEPVDMPDTKVVVESKTKQDSWWKTTGDNAYKYVIPAFTATDYLSTDSSNQHGLATGTNNPTVIDPSEAIAHGFGICHNSIGLSESTQTIAAGASVTVYPKAKATKDAESATNITTAGITITAASAIDPKVSRGNWTNGSLTFTAGTTGENELTVKIKGGAQTPDLVYNGTAVTGIKFDVMEDKGSSDPVDTGVDITASVNVTASSLQLGTFNTTNSKFTVSKASGGSVNIGSSNAIQVGINSLDILVTKGTATPNTPQWDSTNHKYAITADGSFQVGVTGNLTTISQTQGSIQGGFTPEDAINYGKSLSRGIYALTAQQTTKAAYENATTIPYLAGNGDLDGNTYYYVTATPVDGTPVIKKFHTPSGGSGSSSRTATFLEPITLTAPQNPEQDFNWTFDVGSIAHYENPTSVGTVNTNVQIDASAIYQAGIAAASVSGTVDVNKSEWTTVNGASTCFFMPSKGTGQGSSVSITADVTSYQTVYEAGSTANVKIKDRDVILQEKTFWLRKISTADKSYVVLTNTMSLVPRDYMAKYEIEDGGGEQTEQYTVTSIDPITLTASDISSSVTKYPVLRYNDPSQSTDNTVPLQINASAVYTKGLTDGSRLNIEELRTITQPLTQNTSYTFKPSDYKDVMRAIKFSVNVPPVYRRAESLANTIVLPASHKGTAVITGNQVEYDMGSDTGDFSVVIDASNVYEQGRSDGSGLEIQQDRSVTYTSNGERTVYPTGTYGALSKVKVNVDVPQKRIQNDRSVYVSQNGSITIKPTGSNDAMSVVELTVQVPGATNPTITYNKYSGTKTGQDVIGAVTVSSNCYLAIKAVSGNKSTTKYINLSKG